MLVLDNRKWFRYRLVGWRTEQQGKAIGPRDPMGLFSSTYAGRPPIDTGEACMTCSTTHQPTMHQDPAIFVTKNCILHVNPNFQALRAQPQIPQHTWKNHKGITYQLVLKTNMSDSIK